MTTGRAAQAFTPLQRQTGALAPINNVLGTIERALGACLRRNEDAAVTAVVLQAPDGGSWRVSVQNDGTLHTVRA